MYMSHCSDQYVVNDYLSIIQAAANNIFIAVDHAINMVFASRIDKATVNLNICYIIDSKASFRLNYPTIPKLIRFFLARRIAEYK